MLEFCCENGHHRVAGCMHAGLVDFARPRVFKQTRDGCPTTGARESNRALLQRQRLGALVPDPAFCHCTVST